MSMVADGSCSAKPMEDITWGEAVIRRNVYHVTFPMFQASLDFWILFYFFGSLSADTWNIGKLT